VIRPIKLLSIILSPVIWLLGSVRKIIMRIIGTKEPEPMTEQDVKTMVTIGAEVGAIEKEEREMIHRIFKFDDIEVEQVMTPRVEMKALPAKTKLKDIKKLLAKTPYSRIPVYKEELDNVIGIFYVKDAWGHIGGQMNITLEKFVKPAIFVPKTKKIDKLLAQFQREHIHMAVVVGDYGGVLGLVTLEDLLEEIVGEIVDESDPVYTINKAGKNKHEVNGRISLEQVNKALGTTLKSSEYDTLSGFMIEKFDRLPKQNEKLKVGKHTLIATRVRAPKILMITILKNQ
jgi:CBS domain containing-hemolysin-like protein